MSKHSHSLKQELEFFEQYLERMNRAYLNGVISGMEFNIKIRRESERLRDVILRGYGLEPSHD